MSVYKVVEIIGTSSESWEGAAVAAVNKARESIRQLRVAEVVEQDLTIANDGTIESYRTKLRLSFKYETPVGAPEWEGAAKREAQPA